MVAANETPEQPGTAGRPLQRRRIWGILLWLPLNIWRYGRILYRQLRYNVRFKWRLKEFIFINYWVILVLLLLVALLYGLLNKGAI